MRLGISHQPEEHLQYNPSSRRLKAPPRNHPPICQPSCRLCFSSLLILPRGWSLPSREAPWQLFLCPLLFLKFPASLKWSWPHSSFSSRPAWSSWRIPALQRYLSLPHHASPFLYSALEAWQSLFPCSLPQESSPTRFSQSVAFDPVFCSFWRAFRHLHLVPGKILQLDHSFSPHLLLSSLAMTLPQPHRQFFFFSPPSPLSLCFHFSALLLIITISISVFILSSSHLHLHINFFSLF